MTLCLKDIASVIRSKNAGPFELTFDIMLREQSHYDQIKRANALTPELMAKSYGVPLSEILDIIYFDPARAIKVTMRRPLPSGDPGDSDVYGAQQHAPLLALCLEI